MNKQRCATNKGFTLAELLIIVAIIAVLVAVSIPIFSAQLEKSRQATDLANMRSAEAAAVSDWMTGSQDSAYIRYYDAGRGSMCDTMPAGYGKSTKNVSDFSNVMSNAYGIPNTGKPNPITVLIDSDGNVNMAWGGNIEYLKAAAPYKGRELQDLKNEPNEKRVAADNATLAAIGQEILKNDWTVNDLYNNLGILESGNRSAIRLADYYQLKDGSYGAGGSYSSAGVKITSKDNGKFQDILNAIGYDSGKAANTTTAEGKTNTTYEKSLFYSDELASNKFGNYDIGATKRSIIIDTIRTDSSGKITSFTIYSKAMDNQANLNDEEKAKFRVNVTKAP